VVDKFIRFHLPAILWAAVVLFLTLLPSDKLPDTPDWELLTFDTFAHACVFALLTFLVARSFYFQYGKHGFLKFALLVAIVLCTFFGILIELLQTVMKLGRHGETGDVISDFIGAIFGALFCYFLFRRRAAF
jgi:VanZ family protein